MALFTAITVETRYEEKQDTINCVFYESVFLKMKNCQRFPSVLSIIFDSVHSSYLFKWCVRLLFICCTRVLCVFMCEFVRYLNTGFSFSFYIKELVTLLNTDLLDY